MNLRDVDLNLLAAFEALLLDRQVTRAARRLGVGQPAMSDLLRRLRALFGDVLFVRVSGGIHPTPKALALANDILPLLARLREVMGSQVAFAPQEAEATFRVASTDYTTLVLLPGLMALLRAEAPGIDLHIRSYDKDAIGDILDRGVVDLALGTFARPPPGAVRKALCRERFVGLVRRDHPALVEGRMDLSSFAACAHALVSVRDDARGVVDAALEAAGMRRRVALVVPYMLLVPGVLKASDLVATLPERAARQAGTDVVQFDLPIRLATWSVEMLWNPAARTNEAARWLRDAVKRVATGV